MTAVIVATVAMLLASLATARSSEAAATPATDYGASSEGPLPTSLPATSLAPSGTITAMASTPDGFKLQHPGIRRSDHTYDSDTVYQGTYHCTSSSCTLKAEVTVQLHEYVYGGSSHSWQLRANMARYTNPGGYTWSYFATYWCGVNISGASDYTCNNGAAPSNANMSVNTSVSKPWGRTNSITVFPMVQASTQFSNGVKVTTKFRGYDTYSRSSTTRLVPEGKSGTGG